MCNKYEVGLQYQRYYVVRIEDQTTIVTTYLLFVYAQLMVKEAYFTELSGLV